MNNPLTVTEADLHSYVDGALDRKDAARVEEWLAVHPDMAERLRTYGGQNDAFHAAYDSILGEPVPVEMANVVTASRKFGAHVPWRQVAAGIVLLAVGGVSGWGLHGAWPGAGETPSPLAEAAIGAHAVYVSEVKHPVEVGADQEKHLVAWLSNRLGQPIRAPALDKAGYRLIGGRLLPDRGRPAALFMYENEAGTRLTLYARRSGGDETTAFRFASDGGASAFYWVDETFAYALTGTLARKDLLDLAQLVYRDLAR